MRPRGVGPSERIPISSITTRSTKAATSRRGSSRVSSRQRYARRSGRCGSGRSGSGEGGGMRLMGSDWALLVAVLGCATSASTATSAKERSMPLQMTPTVAVPRTEGELAALRRATAWINSEPLTSTALEGKVVLVQFWTYSCINWLRNEPYVRAWAEKYRSSGLVVIGVHSPEFGFEHDLARVRRAARDYEVDYPIAVDNEFAVWRGFDNQYWPALYFFDSKGQLRHRQFGEGNYPQSENVIRRLLAESGATV